MKGTCLRFDFRAGGIALARWVLGLMFLCSGIGKLFNLGGFVNGYLAPAFEKTFLPGWMISSYGYALPFVETLLGAALILGLCRNAALLLSGLTFISLAFGKMLLQDHSGVFPIMFYVAMTGAVLFHGEHDRWVISGKGSSRP